MIKYEQGNLLKAEAEALVNTVNCVGVMGKGIALQFKQAFPKNFKLYEKACKAGDIQLGQMFIVATHNLFYPKYIINFPTKQHWKTKSRLEDIKKGLEDLVNEVKCRAIRSIAVPPLGCGNGGLDWGEVRPIIEKAFADLPEVEVLLYAPSEIAQNDYAKKSMATELPEMTSARAVLIKLIEAYRRNMPDYLLGKLEIQKLAYFVQADGEPLRLRYVKDQFGPYADNLNHVLQRLEGHYIQGYGAESKRAEIYLLEGAVEAADRVLQNAQTAQKRLLRVSQLVEGYETPYGMELLATVHWVTKEDPEAAKNPEVAIARVYDWSERKRTTFRPEHIRRAWQRLQAEGWLSNTNPLVSVE